jgi:hypothetical protein
MGFVRHHEILAAPPERCERFGQSVEFGLTPAGGGLM